MRETITYGLSLPVWEDREDFGSFLGHLARNLEEVPDTLVVGLVVAAEYDENGRAWTATVVLDS